MADLIGDLTSIANQILGVRDDIGAAIHKVYFVTRTWSGTEIGSGEATEEVVLMKPSPGIKNLAHDLEALQGGNYQRGDLMLTNVSKQSYPLETDVSLEFSEPTPNVEKFYRVNNKDYQVISVVESYITWNIQIRKISPR